MHFRGLKKIAEVRRHFELEGVLPLELTNWLSFIIRQIQGHNLRARDPAGESKQSDDTISPPERQAA